ncbi:Cysteine synthase, mitochondrial (fragment) [Xenorhabdus innexi]|uniref:cysteine synthase n=1 Tax=Xenorhabdus innexi TaxID=290109 RepID=A0A1N6MUJ7_9GAMM
MAKEILKSTPNEYVFLDQFSNPSNPKSHFLTTGPEIVNQLNGRNIDVFVAGIGTGGTLMGVGRYLNSINSNAKIVGVQPEGCDFINGKFIPHKIEATSVGIIPSIVDLKIINHMIDVNFDEICDFKKWLIKKYGIFVGISSVGNILAALKEACNYEKDKTIVTIAPDSGRSYLEHQW